MKESEKLIEKKLTDKVKGVGGWAIKLLPTFIRGLPDRICLFPKGRVVFVETKTTGQKVRKIQEAMHIRLRLLGFKVLVIDSTKQIEELIQEYERK